MDTLFRRHYRALCLYAVHFLHNLDAAEDLVQDSFVAYWEKGEIMASEQAYLYRMVHNRCIDILRKDQPAALPEELSMEETIDRSEKEARLWVAIERLPEQRRRCLIMAKREGLSYKEIAAELGISENTVRNHIARADTHIVPSKCMNRAMTWLMSTTKD